MGDLVIKENEVKKPYQLTAWENKTEVPMDRETEMQTNLVILFQNTSTRERNLCMFIFGLISQARKEGFTII